MLDTKDFMRFAFLSHRRATKKLFLHWKLVRQIMPRLTPRFILLSAGGMGLSPEYVDLLMEYKSYDALEGGVGPERAADLVNAAINSFGVVFYDGIMPRV